MTEESLKSKTKKGLYWNFINQISSIGFQFIIGVILARILSPSDYGIVAMPMVFLVIGQTLADCGFGSALIRKPEMKEEDLSTAFYFSIFIGGICYVTLFCVSPLIADFFNTPILKSLLRISALVTLFGPLSSIQSVQLNRRLDFKTPTKVTVITKTISGIISVIMAYNGCEVWSLVLPSVFASFLHVLILYYYIRWLPQTGWSKESFNYLWGYGSKLVMSSILEKIYSYIYPIAIGKFYSAAQLGLYTRAQGYSNLPTTTATSVIQSVTFPVLSKIQEDNVKLSLTYRRMIKCSAFVIFPLTLLLSALAEPLVIILITDKWAECIPLLQLISISLMLYPILSLNLNLLQIKGRSDLFLKVEIVNKIIGVIIMIVTIPLGLIYMCWGAILTSLFNLIVNTYYTGKLINVGLLTQLKDIASITLVSFMMYFITTMLCNVFDNQYTKLCVCLPFGVIFYLGTTYCLKFEELNDIKYLINIKK